MLEKIKNKLKNNLYININFIFHDCTENSDWKTCSYGNPCQTLLHGKPLLAALSKLSSSYRD